MIKECCIILFTRYPKKGEVKTRLIPALGEEGATLLHARMAKHAFMQAIGTGTSLVVAYTGFTENGSKTKAKTKTVKAKEQELAMRAWLDPQGLYPHVMYAEQEQCDDLGMRMSCAFSDAFALGYTRVILVGSDCPSNTQENMLRAVQALERFSCVLGPAKDGGYYLMGLRQHYRELFMGIDWGTSRVLEQTLIKIKDYTLLDALPDVDMPHDIPASISVIIPTCNEEKHLAKTIASVQQSFNTEILVVDGGSDDATCSVAKQLGVRLYCLAQGEQASRALQMNVGARHATGDILLFLHADSLLSAQWDEAVRECLKNKAVSLAHFSFALDGEFIGKKIVRWGTNIRSRYGKMPYGDQGLCMRREDFLRIGGYANTPIFEDVYLVKTAKSLGRIQEISLPLITSGRRWQTHGVLKVTWYNQMVFLALALGARGEDVRNAYREGINPLCCLFKKWACLKK